jgi:hypothetical protein
MQLWLTELSPLFTDRGGTRSRANPIRRVVLCTIDSKTTGTNEAVPALFERERLERFERLRRFPFDR